MSPSGSGERSRCPRASLVVALFGLLTAAPPAAAQWVPTGAPLCPSGVAHLSTDHLVISDGRGGIFAAWQDSRNYSSTGDDVYLQRLTGSGYVAPGWPTDGLGICVTERDQIPTWTATDGLGGALVTWIDQRGDNDIYVQRVTGEGTVVPGWPEHGTAATRAPQSQGLPAVAPDGAGGAYVAWYDQRDYPTNAEDVYAQHLDANGAVMAGWPADGLPVAVAPDIQYIPSLLPDGQGGVIVVWTDYQTPTGTADVYGLRLMADGTIAPGWQATGVPLLPGRSRTHLASDEAGGFYVVCSTESATSPGFAGEYWVQRFTLDGAVASGWPPQGLLVCQAPGPREGLRVASDGAGGVLMTWYDYRIPGGVIFAARVVPAGTLAPGWTANGTLVSDAAALGVEYDPGIAPDGAGGAYVVWNIEYGGVLAYIQHLTAQGQVAPGWPQFGMRVAPTPAQFHPQIVEDSAGGAIVVWDERLAPRLGLYAQKFRLDGPVPTLLALASAQAEPGVVRLVWQGSGAAHFEATVERRSGSFPEWLRLAALTTDAAGRVSYEDRAVEPGARYAYRLRWHEGGAERTTDEAWVEVPRALALALEGLRPNPAVRDLNVAFTLPSPAPARLELLDVAGRQRLVRELEGLGPGRHLLRLDPTTALESGVYWLRLSHGLEQRLARAVVVR